MSHLCHPALSCSAVPGQVGTRSSGNTSGLPVGVSSVAQSFLRVHPDSIGRTKCCPLVSGNCRIKLFLLQSYLLCYLLYFGMECFSSEVCVYWFLLYFYLFISSSKYHSKFLLAIKVTMEKVNICLHNLP